MISAPFKANDELGGIGKVAARDVGWRIGLSPRYHVQDFEAQFRQRIGHGEDVVVRPANPYRPVVLQLVAALRNPLAIEAIYLFGRTRLVPLPLINAHHPSALDADSAIGEEVRWIGKNHVELEVELVQELGAVAVKEGEHLVIRLEEQGLCRVEIHALEVGIIKYNILLGIP